MKGDSWRFIWRGVGTGVTCALPLLCGQTCRRKKAQVLGEFPVARLYRTSGGISGIVGSEPRGRYDHYETVAFCHLVVSEVLLTGIVSLDYRSPLDGGQSPC